MSGHFLSLEKFLEEHPRRSHTLWLDSHIVSARRTPRQVMDDRVRSQAAAGERMNSRLKGCAHNVRLRGREIDRRPAQAGLVAAPAAFRRGFNR